MRYAHLAVLALVLIVSGCTGQQADTPENDTDVDEPVADESPPEQDESTTDVDYSDFELKEIEMPTNVQLGTEFDMRFTVQNEGNGSGVYSESGYFYYTGTSPSIGDGEEVNPGWVNDTVEVAAGETREFNVTRELPYIGSYTYFPASRDTSGGLQVVPKEVRMGQSVTSGGMEVSVENLRMEPNPDDEGFRFGLIDLSVTNRGDESRQAPLREDFAIETDKYDQYSLNESGDFGERYFSSELAPGESKSGVVEFRVAEEYSMENLTGVRWRYTTQEKPVGFIWKK